MLISIILFKALLFLNVYTDLIALSYTHMPNVNVMLCASFLIKIYLAINAYILLRDVHLTLNAILVVFTSY